MLISLNWLKELVDITLSPEELAHTLTIAGFEVEEIIDRRKLAAGVVIGKVLQREPHPDADKLSVCQVDIGQEQPVNIVCGAANVRADIFVPVAVPGVYLPAIDLKLKPTKLRGVPSEGMICSLTELGLGAEADGIHIFSEAVKVGDDVRPYLGLDDVILDLTATANRADALSMVGVAREVAALTGVEVKLPTVAKLALETSDRLRVTVSDGEACPAYFGTVIENVHIGPSPQWLQTRLEAAGVRPINNVVDVTNYVLLEWGQPLHAFDRDRLHTLAGGDHLEMGVRFARDQESLITLDGQQRQLTPQNLVITAGDKAVALAGVMGGGESEVFGGTTNLMLEAALFHPVAIRRSSRSANLRSESSTRYERGVNQVELETAAARAIALITELAGGQAIAQVKADHRPDPSDRPTITLRLSRIHQVLGQVTTENGLDHIAAEDVVRILEDLGCQLQPQGGEEQRWAVTIPPYRYRDLEREIDLIEEVARLYGYDRFCDTLPRKTEPGNLTPRETIRRRLRSAFRAVGLTELVQYSLVKPEQAEVKLGNPLFVEYSALRRDLLTGLIEAFAYNTAQGNGALNGFEIGRCFWLQGETMKEGDFVAGILGGSYHQRGLWGQGGKETPLTWYEAKGILDDAFQSLGLTVDYQSDRSDERLHPGRTAQLRLQGRPLGKFGQLHPQLCQDQDLPAEVYGFELDFELLAQVLAQPSLQTPRFKAFSTYPAVARDLAFFAPVQVTVADLTRMISKAGGKLLTDIDVFDQYQGENVPEGQRSLAFNLTYRASDRTLKEDDIEPVHQKVRDSLVKKFKVTLRS